MFGTTSNMGNTKYTSYCAHCTREFVSTVKGQRYCSRSCSASATQQGKPSKNRKLAPLSAPPPLCSTCGGPAPSYRRTTCHQCAQAKRGARAITGPQSRDRVSVRAYAMARYSKLRTDLIAKLGGTCASCGITDLESKLDFDHIDPSTKSFDVTTYLTRNVALATTEALSKCQLLCRKCHCAKTFNSDAFKVASSFRTGEHNRMSKLTDAQRLYVIAQVGIGRSHRSLARELDVTHQSIGDILKSKYWQERYATHFILDSSSGNFGVVE